MLSFHVTGAYRLDEFGSKSIVYAIENIISRFFIEHNIR